MNCLWRPCLLMERDEISNVYRGPSIDASYQVSVHLTKRFQRRRFFKIGQSETRIVCGGHVYKWIRINASYQVSVHMAEGVSEKIKMWKVNGRRTPSDGKSSHCLWQGQLKKWVSWRKGEGPVHVHMHISTINVPALIFDLILYYLYNKLADEWNTSCDPCEDEKSNIQTKLHLHTIEVCFSHHLCIPKGKPL